MVIDDVMVMIVAILFSGYVLHLAALHKVMNYLRSNLPQKWEELGKPSWGSLCNPVNQFFLFNSPYYRMRKYILSKDEEKDDGLNKVKSSAKRYFKVCQFLYFVLLILFVVFLVSDRSDTSLNRILLGS